VISAADSNKALEFREAMRTSGRWRGWRFFMMEKEKISPLQERADWLILGKGGENRN
jgi:hypothetical protein